MCSTLIIRESQIKTTMKYHSQHTYTHTHTQRDRERETKTEKEQNNKYWHVEDKVDLSNIADRNVKIINIVGNLAIPQKVKQNYYMIKKVYSKHIPKRN